MRRYTENRLICFLFWWFYESHCHLPAKIKRVYGFRSYLTASGRRIHVDEVRFFRTLYRAIGMVFPACKYLWDRGESFLWPAKKSESTYGM